MIMQHKPLLGTLAALCLSACASIPNSAEEAALRERPDQPRMHAELISSMLAQGRNYAAMAHIEELEREGRTDKDQLRLLRASAQYQLEELEAAENNYRMLTETDYAGQAWHGLGLIAAQRNLREAATYFNRAVSARPTDPQIRNDLGYTLMLAGRLAEARHHLATATELVTDDAQSQNNLVLSFLLEAQQDRARKLARSFRISDADFRQLEAESRVIQRLMAQRADEFEQPLAAPAAAKEKSHDRKDPAQRQSIPGLYSNTR